MKTPLPLLCLLLLAAPALGGGLIDAKPAPIDAPRIGDLFFCQEEEEELVPLPANSADGLEFADGIPAEYAGLLFDRVSFYIIAQAIPQADGEIAGGLDPTGADPLAGGEGPDGIELNFYFGSCAPDDESEVSIYYLWDELETELVDEGEFHRLWWVEATLPSPVEIAPDMSIAWVCDSEFSIFDGLICGPLGTDLLSGDCDAMFRSEPLEFPEWTSSEFVYGSGTYDIIYCLGIGQTPVAESGWSVLKSLY